MKKKKYLEPIVYTGRIAALNLIQGIELETIFGDIKKVDVTNFIKSLRQLEKWLLLGNLE